VNAFAVTIEDFDLNYLTSNGVDTSKGIDVVVFNEVLYYVNHVEVMKKMSKLMNKNGIVVISNWFTSKVEYSNTILQTIFKDAEIIYNLLDEITVTGPKGRKSEMSARIGMFENK
jgi:2-polyprenyl-3-methyl-5-hydroxy-6-metoxy-1,4-benzoquinol methylase